MKQLSGKLRNVLSYEFGIELHWDDDTIAKYMHLKFKELKPTNSELLRIPGFGIKSLKELAEFMDATRDITEVDQAVKRMEDLTIVLTYIKQLQNVGFVVPSNVLEAIDRMEQR